MEKVKILFLAANPSRDLRLDDLQLDEEFREIDAKIRSAEYRDELELIPCLAARPDDLRSALLRHQPHVLHFSGHGNPADEIILLDDDSRPHSVSGPDLVDLLKTVKDTLQLVVLNACYSRPLAEAISNFVDCTVGMNKAIDDQAAIKFSGAFYEAMGYAKSVQDAFDLGLSSLKMDGNGKEQTPEGTHRKLILEEGEKAHPDSDDQIPQLVTRPGVDASKVFFVKPKPEFEELTRYARKRIAEEASKWLDKECNPFVMPALARRVTHSESMTMRHDVDPWEQISEEDARKLVLGQLPEDQNRVRVFSESGTGKTTLLHHCEQQIAAADDGRVPVRVTALSDYDWKGDVLAILVNRLLHAFLPADTDETIATEWLRQLVREHQVVLLLDAVDQTDDQLAGFGQFLQSAEVCRCPAILTGRPQVEQTRVGVFEKTNWDTCRVEPFDEPRIRKYLGELSDTLLAVEGEEWEDKASYERKQQWLDLLKVPLLLGLMRRLADSNAEAPTQGSLTDLHNRHAVYREAVRHLVKQGWKSLGKTQHPGRLLDQADVDEYLAEMAWKMVTQDNFTSVFQGEPFRRWRAKDRDAIPELIQVDLTTRYSLLDNPGEFGLAWRHLSFCEYFAGKQLARPDRAEQESIVQSHGRNPSWQWVFRFALSELDADDQQDACNALARDLIRFGNPFLVFDAIRGDGLKLPEQLDTLCRWLVHREWSPHGGDYIKAWNADSERPEVDADVLDILESLFDRQFRDSRCLHPAWEILTPSSDPLATAIQTRFLAEFSEVVDSDASQAAVVGSLSLDEHFIQCPPAGLEDQTFQIGEKPERRVKIRPLHLGKATVTNVQFELFDPSHKQWRDEYSPDDDSPALYVNWPMAVIFCIWLGEGHRLPTEEEWEVACRAGTITKYWWGEKFNAAKCNAKDNVGRATPADPAHANDWGFMDMCGNVWEWCEDEHEDWGRVLRGGAWSLIAESCGCSSRDLNLSNRRNLIFGFRLARTL